MKRKYITTFNKICATVTSLCFVFTLVGNNLFAAVNTDTMQSKKQYFETKDADNLNSWFSNKYGKIVSYNDNSSDTVVINIQDLHCDYFVQKNISGLIDEISKKYNIDNVYVEGGIGNIDTSFLANMDPQYKQDILEMLLKDGKLTGTEYYSVTADRTNLLKGVEEEDVYLKNIVRLNTIIKSKEEISVYLSKIDNEIGLLKSKYLNSENKQLDKLLKQSEKKEIPQEQFIIELFNYAKSNNISLKNYKNLQTYLGLLNYSVNNKKLQKELVNLLSEIKKILSYDDYNKFVKLTSNFTDIQKLGMFVKEICIENNINLKKEYPNLNKFFILKEESLKCNPIELVKEERKLIDVLRTSLSDSESELEVAYISDFEQFYKGYVSASLTATQWEYVKLGLDKFKELYAKYSVANDVEKLEKYSEVLTKFYDVNTERNQIFIQKMGLSTITKSPVSPIHPLTPSTNIFSKAKNIIILVAGGYHTDGINELLNKKGISNITITPNITNSTQQSRAEYEYLAQQQAMSVRQMIALGLISNNTPREQILAIVSSLLKNKGLDGVNINILVQQLNQIFSREINISLMEDGKQLEVTFEDGSTQIIDVDEDIAKLIQEQDMQQFPARPLIQVAGENLKELLTKVTDAVSTTTLNYGTDVIVPQIYQISKDVCLFMVEHRLYLGNGAVWEIATSEYNGQTLDGVEPVVYEYMPEAMQKAMLNKQQQKDTEKKFSLKSVITKIVSFILAIALAISLISCSIKKGEEINYRYSPQISYSQVQDVEFNEEILRELQDFSSGPGTYHSFLYDTMSFQNTEFLTKQEINQITNQENLYDQALVALMYIQQAQMAKENGDITKMNDMLAKAAEVLSAIDSEDVLYKSNLEQHIVTGEILWVGIAATQYKLVSDGSTQFDDLIAKVDKHINMFYRSAGFIYGRADENWVSTEHILDAIAYYNLKLYCDNKYGNSVDFNIQNRLKALSSYLYKELYDKEKLVFYRGRGDNYYVLDTCTWGVQVLSMVEYMNPELFEYGLNGESYLSSIDIYALLDYAETHFRTPVEYHGNVYNNLYTAAEESDNPIMFEWTIQMAISYSIAANRSEYEGDITRAEEYRQKATDIIRDVEAYSADLGFDYPPYVDSSGKKIYHKNGWMAYQVEFVAGLAQLQQYHYGSFYFPLDDTERQIEIVPPSSILPGTIQKINNSIVEGAFSIKNALVEIINKETFKSIFTPKKFIDSHINSKGAKLLTAITAFSFLFTFGMSMILLYGAYGLITQLALAFAASILAAFDVNVGTHVIIDYRYLKSIGLAEAIKLYGKDNVRLTETGLIINNEEQTVPVYVINDKPKNTKDFNFKSVPIKIKAENGKTVKCWMGKYNGATILFAEGAAYETIVKEFGKTRQFETVYGGRTALKANVDVIEIDMINPDSGLNYSQSGNIIVGADMVKTGDIVDLQKEVSLLKNKRVEAVTINQNVAVYIDDAPETISASQDFIDIVNLYVKNDNLGINVKVLFSNKYIDRILENLEQELGDKQAAQEKFIEMIKQLKDENKEVIVMFDEVSETTNLTEYNQYGIFSYIANNEYFDGITATKTQTKFVTNLNQIYGFDGSLSIIKVSAFRKELEKASGIFTLLTSSLNLSEYLKTRSINFVKQVASNFDFDQIPVIDLDIIAQILTASENKFEDLSKYLNGTDSISMYYLGLSNDEQRAAFMEEILKRALVINYLRSFDQGDVYYGLKDKSLENTLANALFEKYNLQQSFEINSNANLNETDRTTATEIEFALLQKISDLSQKAFEQKDPQAIDDIIKLIPLYAERNIDFRTATDIEVVDIKNIKGILSAA